MCRKTSHAGQPVRFKLDEKMLEASVQFLAKAGHDVEIAFGECLAGANKRDPEDYRRLEGPLRIVEERKIGIKQLVPFMELLNTVEKMELGEC